MNIIFGTSKNVKANEIKKLRKDCGSTNETADMWQEAVKESLFIASARDKDENSKLVGIGFVIGNNRHAQLVDLVVRPDYRKRGIASRLIDLRLDFCRKKGILYIGNTFDPSNPWLKGFYEKHGFRQIDFAMWQEQSIRRLKSNESI